MEQLSPVKIVMSWLAAANDHDIDRLVALSAPGIEIIGPRGGGRGHQLLREWMGRAGLYLDTKAIFARDTCVVVAQHGIWRSGETGAVTGEAHIASRFLVEQQQVVQYVRYDDLERALNDAGLTSLDEQTVED
jgi:hypothetical protein